MELQILTLSINSISMKKSINYFGRILCAFMLCTGLVLTSCEGEEPIGGENTEQNGNENNGSENNGNENEGGNETPEPEPLVTASIQDITYNSVEVTGKLNVSPSDIPFCQVVVYYSNKESFNVNTAKSKSTTSFDNDNKFTVALTGLDYNTKYNYSVYAKSKSDEIYTEIADFTTPPHPYLMQTDINMSSATDLSSSASANCYIVSESGLYKFKAVKGNSNESVGNVASAAILWETFGTETAPEMLDLIKSFCYKEGYITFQTADTFKEGNAVIAAKDADGNILWSWHIWLTDVPQEQVYYNNAGTMMDRNLGATSATPGDVGALGLLYQWGRKDPFLSSSSISSNTVAKSTITWPWSDSSIPSIGTIEYAIANPTTFILKNNYNFDWYYTDNSSTDDTRWTTSSSAKSIYDPCPPGWRVPDTGSNGVWSKALGQDWSFTDSSLYDSTNVGMNFSGKFGNDKTIWYPASGMRGSYDGSLKRIGEYGYYWSATISGYDAYMMFFNSEGAVTSSLYSECATGQSIRCLKE